MRGSLLVIRVTYHVEISDNIPPSQPSPLNPQNSHHNTYEIAQPFLYNRFYFTTQFASPNLQKSSRIFVFNGSKQQLNPVWSVTSPVYPKRSSDSSPQPTYLRMPRFRVAIRK